jgi:hypothetical protein
MANNEYERFSEAVREFRRVAWAAFRRDWWIFALVWLASVVVVLAGVANGWW